MSDGGRGSPGRDEHVPREVGERLAQLVCHVSPPVLLACRVKDLITQSKVVAQLTLLVALSVCTVAAEPLHR